MNGNDSNDGPPPETAFRTFSRVNKITLKNGESLLFGAGCKFKGSLKPKRERDGTTVYIGSWGEGDDPIIIAQRGNALIMNDFDHVEVSNLTLTNPNGICGIYVSNSSPLEPADKDHCGTEVEGINYAGAFVKEYK